jgi:glucokinase
VKNLADACRSLREMRDLVLAKSGVSRADLDGVVLNINAIRLKPNRVISSSVIPWIREASEKDFTRALNCPVKMHIQTPWVLPELRLRQADGVNSLIVLSIGDGVSAHGVSVDSQWMSERYYRGELGHVVLDPKGPVCGCGHRGCVEALISGPALLQRVETDLRNGIQTELADRPAKSPVDLFVRLEQLHAGGKDSYVRTLVEEFLDRVAWCVSLIANLVGPDLIALRGYALEGRESWLQRILQRTGPMVLGEVSNLRLAFARASTEDCLRELVRLPSEKTISL